MNFEKVEDVTEDPKKEHHPTLKQIEWEIQSAPNEYDEVWGNKKTWSEEGIDPEKILRESEKPVIEIAGPTLGGCSVIEENNLDRKIFASNIHSGAPVFDQNTGEHKGYEGKVDFQADARKLPFKDKNVGGIFCSCLSPTSKSGEEIRSEGVRVLREKSLTEAHRVLQDGGILVWEGGIKEDIEFAEGLGFKIIRLSKVGSDTTRKVYNAVLMK